jgi:hypothetical protein
MRFLRRPEAPGISVKLRCLYSESRLPRYGWERHGECEFRANPRSGSFRRAQGPIRLRLRGDLLRLRGVREAVIAPRQGVVRLTVYADSFDADTARKLIEREN